MKVSINKEDYLRAMYVLSEQKTEIRSTDIANYLKISRASVSQMLRKLSTDKLIRHEDYSKIRLTAKGLRMAEKLTYKHRIIEKFLKDKLKIEPEEVHEEANLLEHAFTDNTIEKLREFLGNPEKDPHGKNIPK